MTVHPTMTEAVRWTALLLLAALAVAIVAVWRIGPVVLVLTSTHGVHSGDALAGLPTLAGWLLRPAALRGPGPIRRLRTA